MLCRMSMNAAAARALFATARVAHLATVGADGRPHLVPIAFALDGDTLYTAVDQKPKRTTQLRRLENVAANPSVSVLADHYDEQDWSALWWVRADGAARILAPNDPQRARAAALLQARYEQYRRRPPTLPAIAVSVSRWSGWRAADAPQG
jgi:PPOX class probable F420-dependent enzyme